MRSYTIVSTLARRLPYRLWFTNLNDAKFAE